MMGVLKAYENEVRRIVSKSKSKSKKASKLFNDAVQSAELISIYGKAALLTLAGKGLAIDDAREILKKEDAVNEHLIELIIESEKEVLKQRFYRTKKREKI